MAGKPTTVDELMEELEIKDLIIKRLNQNYAEMEREKDKWWRMVTSYVFFLLLKNFGINNFW